MRHGQQLCSPGANGLATDRMKIHRLYMLMDTPCATAVCLPHSRWDVFELLDKGPKPIQ